jgi:DNA-binding XRE family transcriptional regulator
MVVGMAKSEGITFGQLVPQELNDDGGFREEWQRLAPARAFAAVLIRYRAEHDLSQSKLGKRLGVTQPRVAALESGERNPDYETIINAVDKLQVEFAMDFSPSKKPPKLLTKTARAAGSTVTYRDVAVTVTSR